MAKAIRDARNIVVEGVAYRWRATGNDGWISLVLWPRDLPGPTIACTFAYDPTPVPVSERVAALTGQVVITNRVVRRVIEHAIRERGYDPNTRGKQVDLRDVGPLIDLSDALRAT
jgi:hypothetical protein